RAQCPEADVRCVDALDHTSRRFHAFYEATYLFLIRHAPWVWRISYDLLDWAPVYRLVQPFRRRWNLRICRPLTAWLQGIRPEVVVATHFLPADVCSAGKAAGWLTGALVVVVTDIFPHRFWISAEPDAIVISTPGGRQVLSRRGVAPERIHVQGIPIARAFAAPAGDRRALRERFKVAPDRLTVLVTSGGTTVGRFEEVVESLANLEAVLPQRLQLLVVCGQDGRTRARLAERAGALAMPIRIFGFIDHMAELMAASDLIVAKAGGLTVSEALGSGVPIVLYHVIPGQERLNAQFVARHDSGRCGADRGAGHHAACAPMKPLARALRQHVEGLRALGVAAVPAAPRATDRSTEAQGGAASKAERLARLAREVERCRRCPLYRTRTHAVVGDGSPNARLVFVGEAPGRDEDLQGVPFVGAAGQLLTKMIEAMGLRREAVYICNVLKDRPPANRTPLPEEIEACLPFLREQLDIIQPAVICALGAVAAKALLGPHVAITKVRGEVRAYQGIPLVPTFHPAYLLRNPAAKRYAWADLKKVKQLLEGDGR
ncbi:MAG: glycosyltransferase, partial [Candidatus Omnitrophica bacterium]|nr:glycosyltransferase [Candidatus Omnitrophota bacterium]